MCVSADPGLGSLDRPRCPIRSDHEAGERNLEQPEHDQIETDHQQHRHGRRIVQLVDVIEPGQVGGAGECEQHPDQECGPRRPLVELALPPRRALVGLCRFARSPALPKAFVTSAPDNPGTDQREPSQRDIDRRAQGVLGRVGRAGVRQREDDHESERDAGQVRAEQIAQHQLRRTWKQQHHRRRADQRRVQRGRQR